jgi:hypothetical protein
VEDQAFTAQTVMDLATRRQARACCLVSIARRVSSPQRLQEVPLSVVIQSWRAQHVFLASFRFLGSQRAGRPASVRIARLDGHQSRVPHRAQIV